MLLLSLCLINVGPPASLCLHFILSSVFHLYCSLNLPLLIPIRCSSDSLRPSLRCSLITSQTLILSVNLIIFLNSFFVFFILAISPFMFFSTLDYCLTSTLPLSFSATTSLSLSLYSCLPNSSPPSFSCRLPSCPIWQTSAIVAGSSNGHCRRL